MGCSGSEGGGSVTAVEVRDRRERLLREVEERREGRDGTATAVRLAKALAVLFLDNAARDRRQCLSLLDEG